MFKVMTDAATQRVRCAKSGLAQESVARTTQYARPTCAGASATFLYYTLIVMA